MRVKRERKEQKNKITRSMVLFLTMVLFVCCGALTPAAAGTESFTEGSLEVASSSNGLITFEGDEEYSDSITPIRSLKSRSGVLPSQYTTSKLTDVLNQGATSLCWAFSALDSGQIGMLKNTSLGTAPAFSAGHLGYASYHGLTETWSASGNTSWYSIGGNGQIAASTLLRWYGAAPFSSYPSTSSLTVATANLTDSQSHLVGFQRLPSPASQTTDAMRDACITAIKKAVVNYGAVSIDYYFKKGSSYYAATNSVYTSQKTTINHESVIVGWDDSKETAADSAGAFLVKNSYGENFGENGFVWLSYYDASMSYPYVFQFENRTGSHKDTDLYSYDGIGYWVYLQKANSAISAANVFTAARAEYIDAVGFYAPDGGSFSVELRTNMTNRDPSTGTVAASVTGSNEYFGFYTVSLPSPVLVEEGKDFAVCLTMTKGTTGWMYFEGDSRDVGKLFRTTNCGTGQTYLKKPGGAYTDILEYVISSDGATGARYGNACIKAYGNPANGVSDGTGPNSAAAGLALRAASSQGQNGEGSESDQIVITDEEIEANADQDDGKPTNTTNPANTTNPSNTTNPTNTSAATNTSASKNTSASTSTSSKANTSESSTTGSSAASSSGTTAASTSGSSTSKSYVTVYRGVDYSAVYDFNYYMKKYPSLKKKYKDNPAGALKYFVKYGMKKMHRASKSFNVKSYVNEYSSLRRKYGTTWKKYYLHYIKIGKKNGWHGTGCSKMKNPLTKYKGKNYKKVYDFNYYIKRYPSIKKKYRYDDYGALKYWVTKGRKAGQKAKK